MKRRKILMVILVILALLAALGVKKYQDYQAQFAYFDETRYEKVVQTMDLSGQPLGDLEQLKQFPELKSLDLRGTGIGIAEYEMVKSWFPDAEVLWDIPFQGGFHPMDTEKLTVTSLSEEDIAALAYFTELKAVSGIGCPDYQMLHQLRIQRPDLEVTYEICAAGVNYAYDIEELVLPGADAEALLEILPYFTELKTLELTAPMAEFAHVQALMDALPEVSFSWNLELGGFAVDQTTETLDLTGIPMTVEEMDAVLPFLLSLTYVDMTDCGISNEEMDALNRRYENIKIVWTVDIGRIMRVKTDETWFMPGKWRYWVSTSDVYNLRYCTDMICVDIGHMQVKDCEWARYMPKLKYLLIADTLITDLSPIAGLQELVFLEIFLTKITDYSPMLECPALEDINLHFTYGDPEIIKQLTWVKNVWWRNIRLDDLDRQELREALPNTHFEFWTMASTGAGWRRLQNYYDHRDLMGMYYMD